MQVHQMSISYQPEQDRILVRFNTSDHHELQFWFTRRLTLGLAPLMERLTTAAAARRDGPATTHLAGADPITQKAMSDFRRDETIRGADFSTPYQSPGVLTPLFDSPLLITQVNLSPLAGGALRMQCSEKLSGRPQQPRKCELMLSDTLTHALLHLLERAVVASQWRETTAAGATPSGATPAAPTVPGYLN